MPYETEKFDRSQKKLQKIVILVVVPILVLITGLMALGTIETEKPTKLEIFYTIDLKCYNINWFGTHGFQVTYKDSIVEIAEKIAEYDYDFVSSEFFETHEVVQHLLRVCPHIDSRLQVPEEYDPTIGSSAIDKCFEVKVGMIGFEDYCLEFKE